MGCERPAVRICPSRIVKEPSSSNELEGSLTLGRLLLYMKVCVTCRQQKPDEEFSRKGKGLQSSCKLCVAEYHRRYYARNKVQYMAKNRRNKMRQRARLRAILWEVKQRPCLDCGGIFHPWVMELDHRDGTNKVAAVGRLVGRGCTDEQLLLEIDKCDVVCANCHRMRTYNRLQN